MSPARTIFQRLRTDRQEHTQTFLLFCYLFCVVSASTIGRTAADTLFLSRFGPSQLSLMYLPQAAALILMGFVYQQLSARFRPSNLLPATILTVSVLALGSRFLVAWGARWVFPVVYVGYDVLNMVMVIAFWQFASTLLDQRKVKQTIVVIGTGGIVGGIASGFGLKLLVGAFGTENLILFYAGLQALCLALALALLRQARRPGAAAPGPAELKKPARAARGGAVKQESLFQHGAHLKHLAILSGTLIVALTLIDYQFKVILQRTLHGEALAAFMGNFHGYAGLLSLLVQLLITSRFITRFGVIVSLVVFPVALFAGSLALWLMPVMLFAVVLKGSDKALGDTLHASVSQLILFPIAPAWQDRAKGFLGMVRNGAKGLAAVAIIVLARWLTVSELSWIILGLLAGCILAAIRIKGPYMQTLLATLQTQGFNPLGTSVDVIDPDSRHLLSEALHSPDKHQVIYALRLLNQLDAFDLRPHLAGLLAHPEAEVAVAALQCVQQTQPPGAELLLLPLLQAHAPNTQAAALLALAAYAHDDHLEVLTAALEAPAVEVKAAAVAGLIKYFGIEGMYRAVGTLKALAGSSRAEERTAMAALFGLVGVDRFYKPLIPLLRDPSAQVRVQAVHSAGALRVPELIPHLVPLLQAGLTRQPATEALAGYGEKVLLEQLEPFWLGSGAALHLPRLYERIGTQRAFDTLVSHYGQLAADVREKVLETLLRLKRVVNRIDPLPLEQFIYHEIERYWHLTAGGLTTSPGPGYDDLVAAADQMRTHTLTRIFQLLALLYDTETVEAVRTNWLGSDIRRQANAMEVMDQLLQGSVRTAVNKVLAAPYAAPAGPRHPTPEHLLWLYEHGDEWLQQVLRSMWHKQTGKADSFVVFDQRFGQESARTDWNQLNEQMERVRLLKQVTIFKGLSGKDLAAIARLLEEVTVQKGQPVMEEHQPGDSLYLVQRGQASVFRNAVRIGALGPGECFGETAVLTLSPRTATVRAEEDLVLWCLDSRAFYEIAFDRTDIALEIVRYLSRRLRQLNERLARPAAAALALLPPAETPGPTPASTARSGSASTLADAPGSNRALLRRVLILQKISLFQHFSPDDFVRLATLAEEVVYEPGELLFRTGERGDAMYGILEGRVRVQRGTEQLAVLQAGECFGEMALIDDEPRSADCSATGRTTVLELTREQVFFFCFQRPDVLKGMMKTLAERLKSMQEKI